MKKFYLVPCIAPYSANHTLTLSQQLDNIAISDVAYQSGLKLFAQHLSMLPQDSIVASEHRSSQHAAKMMSHITHGEVIVSSCFNELRFPSDEYPDLDLPHSREKIIQKMVGQASRALSYLQEREGNGAIVVTHPFFLQFLAEAISHEESSITPSLYKAPPYSFDLLKVSNGISGSRLESGHAYCAKFLEATVVGELEDNHWKLGKLEVPAEVLA